MYCLRTSSALCALKSAPLSRRGRRRRTQPSCQRDHSQQARKQFFYSWRTGALAGARLTCDKGFIRSAFDCCPIHLRPSVAGVDSEAFRCNDIRQEDRSDARFALARAGMFSLGSFVTGVIDRLGLLSRVEGIFRSDYFSQFANHLDLGQR
jgi:hypothetical protein